MRDRPGTDAIDCGCRLSHLFANILALAWCNCNGLSVCDDKDTRFR